MRVWIDNPDDRQRPIGITALEDKIVQKCLVWEHSVAVFYNRLLLMLWFSNK